MSKRKIIDEEAQIYADFGEFDGKTPEQIIEGMQKFRAEYPDRDLYFAWNYYGYDGGCTLQVRERRLESDSEYKKRIAQEKKARAVQRKAKADKLEKERQEYERLKKKFEV